MLTLYSFGPGANSLKALLTLYEKGLDFTSRFLNPATFEHHSEWFKKINPNGQVPVLDHDGKIVTESTVICEYLEDEFPGEPSLRPADSYGRALIAAFAGAGLHARWREAVANNGEELEVGRVAKLWNTKTAACH
jgi:glutathione S-transferase